MYLIFDIETVVDYDLLYETNRECIGPNADGNLVWEPREVCIDRVIKQACQGKPVEACFVPKKYHTPVVVSMLAVTADGSYIDHQVLNATGPGGTEKLVKGFWTAMEAVSRPPVNAQRWVSFNGKSFDAPVMELWAYRHGLQVPLWFRPLETNAWEDPRNKALKSPHLDLLDYMAPRWDPSGGGSGSLSYWSRVMGLPGKTGLSGADSARLWKEGKVDELEDYCLTDVLNSTGLLLGVLRGMGHDVAPRSEAFERTMLKVCDSRPRSKVLEAFWKAYKPTLPF